MHVIKAADIKIESFIENLDSSGLPEEDPERTVIETDGFYNYNDSSVILTYSEKGDGGEVSSEVRASGDTVTVIRRGAIESEFRFRRGEEYSTLYSVPPYKFDTTIRSRRVGTELSESGGKIELLYNMKIGGAEKSVRMKIWIQAN